MNISDELVEMLRMELDESKLYRELGQAGVNNVDDVIMKNLRRINIRHREAMNGLIKDNKEKDVAIAGYIMFADEVQKELKEKDERIEESENDLCACLTVRDQLNIEWHDAHKTIDEITCMRVDEVEKTEALEAELSARKEDSKVLMQVVEIVKRDDRCPTIINQLADLLVDYLDVPVGIDTDETEPPKKQIGTRIICADEVYTIDERKMKAVRGLIDCGDTWVVYTDDRAVEVANQLQTIAEHHDDLCEDLRAARDRYYNWYEDQHHMIKKIRDVLAQPNPRIDEIAKIIQEE